MTFILHYVIVLSLRAIRFELEYYFNRFAYIVNGKYLEMIQS